MEDHAILANEPKSSRLVTASVISADRDSSHLIFNIHVSEPGDGYLSYGLFRRYEAFAAMHAAMQAQPELAPRLPSLPAKPRKSTKVTDDWSIIDRLGEYLRSIVSDPLLVTSGEVRGFLELSAADQLSRKLREREEMFLQVARVIHIASRTAALAPTPSRLLTAHSPPS